MLRAATSLKVIKPEKRAEKSGSGKKKERGTVTLEETKLQGRRREKRKEPSKEEAEREGTVNLRGGRHWPKIT